jgi:hypothetical protein
MSRRPQEPPRSVSRHHRMTFLKTSGIVARLCPRMLAVNIFLERGIHAIKSGPYAHPCRAPRTPRLAFKNFQEKRFAKPSFRVFWTAD